MVIPIIKSIWYLITYCVFFSGLFAFKKSDEKLNGVSWITITFLLIMCFNTLVAAVINIILIPVNIFTLSLFNLAAGLVFWFMVLKHKKKQEYCFEAFDFIVAGILIIIVVLIAFKQFGTGFYINYKTSDPSIHLQNAMNVYNTGKVTGILFAPVNNALFIELLSPLTSTFYFYKIYIVADILMFLLSGMMFFALMRKYMDKPFMKVMGALFSIAYLLGYPLNNELFSFVYLGMSVSVIALIIFFCDNFISGQIMYWLNAALLGLSCLSLFLCYMEFMPAIYVGVFLCICLTLVKNKKLFKLKTLYTLLAVFGIPIIIGMYYFFTIFNSSTQLTAAMMFTFDGGIYRDLYASFVIIAPFALFGLIMLFKNKEFNAAVFSFFALAIFMIVLYALGVYGKAAGYYYFKCYFPLWLIVCYLFVYGVYCLTSHAKTIFICYMIVWLVLAIFNFSGLEEKLVIKNPKMTTSVKSSAYFDIYNYNAYKLVREPSWYNQNVMDAYKYVYDNLLTNENKPVQFVGFWEKVYWYEAITNQRINEKYCYWWTIYSGNVLIQDIKDGLYGKYVMVQKPDPLVNFTVQSVTDGLEGYERVFENDFAIIYLIED